MNSHFLALLVQNFLTGYNKPCELRLPFMALPILLYKDSREKLLHANRNSKLESLFKSSQKTNEYNISDKTRLSGFVSRYEMLKDYGKKTIIILASEEKIVIRDYKIILLQPADYNQYQGSVRTWTRCAYYLGNVFAKTNEDHLAYFLGVETK